MKVFTAQDFLSAFFSALKLKNTNVVSSEELFALIDRHHNDFLNLFMDIDIVNNNGTICSDELEEGISMLQIIGAVGKANPKYERIILKMHKESAKEMLEACDPDYRSSVDALADVFLSEME